MLDSLRGPPWLLGCCRVLTGQAAGGGGEGTVGSPRVSRMLLASQIEYGGTSLGLLGWNGMGGKLSWGQ